MEAKDKLMEFKALYECYKKVKEVAENVPNLTAEGYSFIKFNEALEAQAEISFNAGYDEARDDWNKALDIAIAESFKAGIREVAEKTRTSLEFAYRVAKVMDELRSSQVFFILQQAWGDIEWEEAQDILNTVLEQAKLEEWGI